MHGIQILLIFLSSDNGINMLKRAVTGEFLSPCLLFQNFMFCYRNEGSFLIEKIDIIILSLRNKRFNLIIILAGVWCYFANLSWLLFTNYGLFINHEKNKKSYTCNLKSTFLHIYIFPLSSEIRMVWCSRRCRIFLQNSSNHQRGREWRVAENRAPTGTASRVKNVLPAW